MAPTATEADAARADEYSESDWNGFSDSDAECASLLESHHGSPSRPSDPSQLPSDSSLNTPDDDSEIEAPPSGHFGPVPSVKELQELVNKWAKRKGFTVVRTNGRSKRDGEYSRYDLTCDRYGQPRPKPPADEIQEPRTTLIIASRPRSSLLISATATRTVPRKRKRAAPCEDSRSEGEAVIAAEQATVSTPRDGALQATGDVGIASTAVTSTEQPAEVPVSPIPAARVT